MTRSRWAAVLTITTLLLYGVPPAHAQGARIPVITWATCPEDEQVQCGTMRVPADWADPYGATTLLTIARRKATDPAHRIGALLVNPGGPGGSAVDFTFDAPTFFGAEVRKRFDIVGMDPRGVGRSSPVLCSQDLVDEKPSPLIETEHEYAAAIDYNRRLAADCASRSGPVFGHVDTGSVVRDTEAVRVALGEEKISFYGASYGTQIGAQYSQAYPQRLRALVLDGVMDHSAGLADFLIEETAAAQDGFVQFVAWCKRDARCVLRGQDINKLWARLMAEARAGKLVDPYDPKSKLRLSDLTGAAFAAFYDPQWYSFAYYLRDAAGMGVAGAIPPLPPPAPASTAAPASAVPSTPASAVPSTPASAVPSTPASAVPSTPASAPAPASASALPSTPAAASTPASVSARPSTSTSTSTSTSAPASPSTPRPGPTPPAVDIVDHSFPAVFCEDWYLPITGFKDLRRRLAILAGRAPQMLASPLAISATAGCLGWPSAPNNPQRPLVAPHGMGPILLINAVHDPATAYPWAQRVARQLGPGATLLTYEGWGHVIYNRSPCVSGAADKYLLTLTPPAAGTKCPAIEPEPFGVG